MNTREKAAVAAVVMLVAISAARASESRRAASDIFYKCASGYDFEVSGSAARCRKPALVEQRMLAGCPVGLYPMPDRIGNKDICAATNPISGEIDVEQGCTPADIVQGYVKKIVAGRDYCARTRPEEITAPSLPVSLKL